MILKVPSNDWSDQFEYVVEEDDSLSDLEDEQDFSEYLWMENEEEFDKNVSIYTHEIVQHIFKFIKTPKWYAEFIKCYNACKFQYTVRKLHVIDFYFLYINFSKFLGIKTSRRRGYYERVH